MLSTLNSLAAIPRLRCFAWLFGGTPRKSLSAPKWFVALVLALPFSEPAAQTNQPTAQVPVQSNEAALRAERLFAEAQKRFRAEPANAEAAWQFGRAAFDRAEFAANDSHRAAIAEKGVAACRQAIARDWKVAAAHYYLALNLGQLAEGMRDLGGLKLVAEMERELKAARQIDPGFDFAGPDRSLGMLYRDAPGWPISVGSRAKARCHLRRAVNLAPVYPENWLRLLEAYLAWGEKKAARAELKTTEDMLEQARENLTGEQWTATWQDWEKRWAKIKTRATEPLKPLKTPRDKSS